MLTWWKKMCLLSSTRAFLGLSFFKSRWFICFHKAEQRCLLVSRTHTCSLLRSIPTPRQPPPHQGGQKRLLPAFWFCKSVNSKLFGDMDPFENLMETKELLAEKCIQMHIHNFACDLRGCMVVCVYKLRIWHASFRGHSLEMVSTFVSLHWASSLGCTRKGEPQFLTSKSCCS